MKKIIRILIIVLFVFIFADLNSSYEAMEMSVVAESKTIEIFSTKTPNINKHKVIFEPRYGFTDEDVYLLTQLLCGDKDYHGDGEYDFDWSLQMGFDINYEEINKVLGVVMNRVRSDNYPDTVKEVVLQPCQFIVFPKNLYSTPDEQAIEVVRQWCIDYDNWVYNKYTIPEDHLYFSAGPNLTNVTRAIWR